MARNGHDHEFPQSESEFRPYRLWDAKAVGPDGEIGAQIRWRYYGHLRRAHMGALIEARWADVGRTIEVFDCRTAKLLGQYTRRVNTIEYKDTKHDRYE